VRLVDLSPAQLPDLFYGEELVVFGRYRGAASGTVVIEGERNGRRERFSTDAVFSRSAPGNEFIPRLWASRRIGDLTRQIRLEGQSESLIREVRELGLRYGILTEYTSYLVQEPTVVASGRNQPMMDVRGFAGAQAPAAPMAQTGDVAFRRAKESGRLSQATTLAEAEAAAEDKLEALGSRDLRRVGGRVFAEVGGVWTDVNHGDSLRVTTVAPFSKAYFAIVRALPELGPSLKVGDTLLVAGRRVSLKIAAGGRESLSDAEVREFVKAFRGV
jgi:Ca-activated chloride channel family protein